MHLYKGLIINSASYANFTVKSPLNDLFGRCQSRNIYTSKKSNMISFVIRKYSSPVEYKVEKLGLILGSVKNIH